MSASSRPTLAVLVLLTPSAKEKTFTASCAGRCAMVDFEPGVEGLRRSLDIARHNGRALDRHLEEFSALQVVSMWAMGGLTLGLLDAAPLAALHQQSRFVHAGSLDYSRWADPWTPHLCGRRSLGRSLRPSGLAHAGGRTSRRRRYVFVSEGARQRALCLGLAAARLRSRSLRNPPSSLDPAPEAAWLGAFCMSGELDPNRGNLRVIDGFDTAEARLRTPGSDTGVAEAVCNSPASTS